MKIVCKKTRVFEAALTVAIALVFIMPCATVLAKTGQTPDVGKDINWMGIEYTVTWAGDQGHIIPIAGNWNDELAGYCIGLQYDSDIIEIVGITLEDTVADYDGSTWIPGYWSWDDEIITASTFTVGTDFIPAGNGVLFNIIVNINEDVEPGYYQPLLFYEDLEAQPPIKNRYYLSDSTGVAPDIFVFGALRIMPEEFRPFEEAYI